MPFSTRGRELELATHENVSSPKMYGMTFIIMPTHAVRTTYAPSFPSQRRSPGTALRGRDMQSVLRGKRRDGHEPFAGYAAISKHTADGRPRSQL